MNIQLLNRSELKILFIALLNCRSYFTPPDCETLLKYITMCFCLSDVTITAEASVKLMNSLQEILKRRIREKTGQSQTGEDDMLTIRGGFTN
jgi:hypothetical protein